MHHRKILPKSFAKDLIAGVRDLESSLHANNYRGEFSRWTSAVKMWLTQESEHYHTRPISTDGLGASEFLLDFVWWGHGKAELACECEWGNTRDAKRNAFRVAEDFDKLLSFKAPFKLMIFDSYSEEMTRSEVINKLEQYLREYTDHRKSETYLVIDLCKEPAAWLCEIQEDGGDPSLSLELINLKETSV